MDYILKFVTDAGEFLMGDGRHDYFKISSVRGLGFPEVERQTVVYTGRRGEKTVSKRFLPRVITICGDVLKKESVKEITSYLSESGVLYIKQGDGERKINVTPTAMEDIEKIGDVTRLVIQFTADDPAFCDTVAERVGIYERADLVSGTFTLPCVFTKRVEGGTLINSGDVISEPVITVICNGASETEASLVIKNKDTGAKIDLKKSFAEGDTVTIDTQNAEIYDQNGNSLLSYISNDTYISEFVLKKGENEISVVSSELSSQLIVVCEFDRKYLEANI